MTPAQACGNCKWWDVTEVGDDRPGLGKCKFPLPFFVPQSLTYEDAGKDCPTWTSRQP